VFILCRLRVAHVIILDTPDGDFIEISYTSYNFLLFSMKASSDHAEGAGAAPRVSSSMSIGDLWLEIDSS
jgi:hypothetical protein